jgi:hypothetical protein
MRSGLIRPKHGCPVRGSRRVVYGVVTTDRRPPAFIVHWPPVDLVARAHTDLGIEPRTYRLQDSHSLYNRTSTCNNSHQHERYSCF